MEDFDYVVRKQERQKICFGSVCPRDTSRKGMSPFMRRYTLDNYPNVAPNKYNILESFNAIRNKPCSHSISKKGYSGIARFGNQINCIEETPSPFNYNVGDFSKRIQKSKYSTASTNKRDIFITNKSPGPGMYVMTGKQNIKFEHSFGGRVKLQLGVLLKCCNNNVNVCKICGQKPIGDYWHYHNKIVCRPCMANKFQKQSKCMENSELLYKVRDCLDIHLHEGTNAKIWLIHPKTIMQRIYREAYLTCYIKD